MATTTEEIELTLTTSGGKTVKRTIGGIQEEIQDVEEESSEAGQEASESFERMGEEARETAQEVDRAAGSMDRASTSARSMAGSNADEFLFTLGEGAADAKFGMEGVANNIGLAAEQAAQMSRQAGGAKGALKALGSSILGPAGVVAAITALTSLGPEILKFFQNSEDAVKSWKNNLESAADEVFEVEASIEGLEVKGLEDAKAVANQLEQGLKAARDDVEALERLSALTASVPEVREQARQRIGEEQALGEEERSIEKIIQDLRTRFDLEQATSEEIDERLQQERTYLKELEAGSKKINKIRGQLRAQKELREAIEEEAGDVLNTETQTADAIGTQAEKVEALKAETIEVGKAVGEWFQNASIERGPSLGNVLGDLKPQTIDAVNASIGQLQRMLDSDRWGQGARGAIRSTIDELKSLRKEMMLTRGEAVDLGPALERGLANAIANVAKAVGTGESVAEALLTTLATLAQRVGKMLIGFGTAALSLQQLVTNPAAAIAAGAALVALGAAAKSAVSSAVGDVSGEDHSRDDAAPSVPNMNQGGHVEAGQPVLVGDKPGGKIGPHTELFVPDQPGTVVPNSQLAMHRKTMGALSMARPPRGGSAMKEGLEEVARRLDDMEFRLRGTDLVTVQDKTREIRKDAGIE